jgi:hypothetical protein
MLRDPPDRVDVRRTGGAVTISWRVGLDERLFTLLLVWMLTCFVVLGIVTNDPWTAMVTGLLATGVGYGYMIAVWLFGRHVVTIDAHKITHRLSPLPWGRRRRIDRGRVAGVGRFYRAPRRRRPVVTVSVLIDDHEKRFLATQDADAAYYVADALATLLGVTQEIALRPDRERLRGR